MLAHGARPEPKRPHIERAALQLFMKRGFRGTTVWGIAARARVAEGTLVLPPHRETRDFLDEATSPVDVLAEIVREGQQRGEFAPDIDARLMARQHRAGEFVLLEPRPRRRPPA